MRNVLSATFNYIHSRAQPSKSYLEPGILVTVNSSVNHMHDSLEPNVPAGTKLTWITSAGGPLLFLEEHLLAHWHGYDTSDYDRVCSINDYLGVLDVGPGQGLVLGEEPMPTAWRSFPEWPGGMFIRWQWAEDDNSVLEAIADLQRVSWEPTGIVFDVANTSLLLFDAVCPGKDADCNRTGCRLSIRLKEGQYFIETAHYQPDESTALILHRLMISP